MKIDLKTLVYPVSVALPNRLTTNYLLATIFFLNANRRLPRRPQAANAAINDFIFDRMISDRWSPAEIRCVDKEYAKVHAASVSGVKVPRTVDVFPLQSDARTEHFLAWLKPYLGQHLVAKPTHGSGAVLFLDREPSEHEISAFLARSNRNFFHPFRETQYTTLQRKVLIEENLATGADINDYKFFCAAGHVLYCQVDVDRFTNHKRAICTLPEFAVIPVRTKLLDIPRHVDAPPHLRDMVRTAAELSREFGFVRIDLYDVPDGVYFGEYTFSPGAACDNFSDGAFATEFLQKVRSCLERPQTG
jgi:hypothetical protein